MAEQEPIITEAMEEAVESEEEMLRDEKESVLEAFMRYQCEAAREARMALEALIPEGTRSHGKAAKRAFRKAFKVVLQDLARRIELPEEEKGPGRPPSTTGKAKVKVEVS